MNEYDYNRIIFYIYIDSITYILVVLILYMEEHNSITTLWLLI